MRALTFHIHLLEPVLVNQVGGGDPNSAIGFNFIPGSVIRGALIGKYLKRGTRDATDKDFRRLFFDGTVRFLNAYPLTTQTKRRTLPTPVSWRVKKDEVGPIYDIYDIAIKDPDPSKTLESVKVSFCSLCETDEDNSFELCEPATQIKIHTYRANRQNVTDKDSTIFRYLALDSDQKFAGVIMADDKSDMDRIAALLSNGATLGLGKSHLAGYGHVRIENVATNEDWKEYEPVGDDAEDAIIVTLLSDAIVRDRESGAYVASIEPILGDSHKKAFFIRTCVRGGFNRTWNLPLPQTLAIQAGSVFVYENDPVLRNRLKALEHFGIGEKREEGFGRIAIDWNRADEIKVEDKGQITHNPSHVTIKGESEKLAKRIVNRMMKAKLDQALIKTINNMSIESKGSIHNSQLSRMRVVARRALSEDDAGLILQHLKNMKKPAESQFKNVKIEGKSLYEWLKERAGEPNSIQRILREGFDKTPSVGKITPDMTDDLALEYTVRLIDGVLHKTIKLKEANNE